MKKTSLLILSLLSLPSFLSLQAQTVVPVGRGSYASYAPLIKSRSDEHGGDQSRYMQYRPLHLTEPSSLLPLTSSLTRPIPTNDWWTDMLKETQTFSGHLWSYPQYVQAQSDGVDVVFPDYWIQNGTEMKPTTRLHIGAKDFAPACADVEDWSDWHMTFVMKDGEGVMRVTTAHGMPFTWIEGCGLTLDLPLADAKRRLSPSELGGFEAIAVELSGKDDVGADHTALYGIYTDNAAAPTWAVVALLNSIEDLSRFAPYAVNVPRSTRVDWAYDEQHSKVTTSWHIDAENLVDGSHGGQVLQGFIPHHYRDGAQPRFDFLTDSYATPHGRLKLAAGNSFDIDYAFSGMLPYYALPTDGGFNADIMTQLLADYAAAGSFGADTYWGGKGLTQMALYMTFAREMGNEALFRQCRDRLKEALVDWLTWTPGEERRFFARDNRWGAMIGYDTSYDSETFNDHHFHYGYFTYAGALLALVDDDFRVNYGPMLREVAKDYANWERDDERYPLFRTFDPWSGHSFAGGMGDGNGNGQESSSEAMQSWGGLYLLGVALDDKAMRDAGLFGYVSEARATAEYWFDRHRDNIDYTKYDHPYNSNLTCHGVGWWNYFSGDQLWNAAIQWMPISPCLDYLSEDLDYARWDYETAWQLKSIGGWFDKNESGSLGDGSGLGNVVLSYLQRHDPQQAADVFDQLWARGLSTAKATDTGGITYFITHSHLTYGDIDWTVSGSVPTSRAFKKADGSYTFMVYNPKDVAETVTFTAADGTVVGELLAQPRQLTTSSDLSEGGKTRQPLTEIVPVDTSDPDPRAGIVMQNLALGRPCTESGHENAGTVPQNATDGDRSSRWGSLHKDGEWIYVDLGRTANIYKVGISWEAAYASEYQLEVSDDAKTWRNATPSDRLTTSGGQDYILTADPSSSTGMAHGRYVRVFGTKRATQYGISLYELEVFGHYADAAPSDLMGIRIAADADVLTQYKPAALTAEGYTVGGEWTAVTPSWSSADGDITSDGSFTPSAYGMATVTATVGTMKAQRTLPVEEAIVPRSLSLKADVSRLIVDTPTTLHAIATDQFGGPFATEGAVTYTVKHNGSAVTNDIAAVTIDANGAATFCAHEVGDYVVTAEYAASNGGVQKKMTAETTVSVCLFSDVNLALGKPVTTTSQQNNSARYITDGNPNTRWESVWGVDPQDVTVNLKERYMINRVSLLWEAAAAKNYDILVSVDGESWTRVAECNIDKAGLHTHEFSPIEARYVRIHGTKRLMTAYGYSLFELEVYGTGMGYTVGVTAPEVLPSEATSPSFLLTGQPAGKNPSGVIVRQGEKRVWSK